MNRRPWAPSPGSIGTEQQTSGNVFHHGGAVIVPLGCTDDIVYAAGGNLYGTSWPAGFPSNAPDEVTLDCARFQGARLTRFATLLPADRAPSEARG